MIPLYVYDEHDCDPKKCTSRKMVKFKLVQELKGFRSLPYGSIVLTPFSEKALSPEDKAIGHQHGIVVRDLCGPTSTISRRSPSTWR
jgi:pre-rRNA-processing protein TSR3